VSENLLGPSGRSTQTRGLRFVTPKNVSSVKMRAGIEPEFGSGYVGPHEAGFLLTLSTAARNDGDVSINLTKGTMVRFKEPTGSRDAREGGGNRWSPI
jgi:hypothetical protein